jgi:hypothetical protein
VNVNQTSMRFLYLAALVAPAHAADTDRPKQSLQDARPECMERNGPNCVIDDGPRTGRRGPPPVAPRADSAAKSAPAAPAGSPQGTNR